MTRIEILNQQLGLLNTEKLTAVGSRLRQINRRIEVIENSLMREENYPSTPTTVSPSIFELANESFEPREGFCGVVPNFKTNKKVLFSGQLMADLMFVNDLRDGNIFGAFNNIGFDELDSYYPSTEGFFGFGFVDGANGRMRNVLFADYIKFLKSKVAGKVHRVESLVEATYNIAYKDDLISCDCNGSIFNVNHDGTGEMNYSNEIYLDVSSIGNILRFDQGVQIVVVDGSNTYTNFPGTDFFLDISKRKYTIKGSGGYVNIY